MITKGRSPTMRHVSRTHRDALDWLLDRINLEPKIQIRYIDTKHQMADILTKGSFTRDEWNHLRMFKILNFSMFSCSHFSNFLSDPTRKQSAMLLRGPEATSNAGSPMAKPQPMNSAMAKSRPMNLVLHNPLNARKNPPQDLRDPVNSGNVDEEQGGHSSSGKPVRTDPNQDPIEYSQLRRWENNQHADSWKQGDRDEPSSSTGSGKLVRAVNTKESQNMKITNHRCISRNEKHQNLCRDIHLGTPLL